MSEEWDALWGLVVPCHRGGYPAMRPSCPYGGERWTEIWAAVERLRARVVIRQEREEAEAIRAVIAAIKPIRLPPRPV